MLLKLSGSFRVHTPDSAIKYIDAVKERLEWAIREEQTSTIHQTSTSITFRRGYNEWPHSANRLASFDPGNILLQAEKEVIFLRYDLGLKPLYGIFAILAASLVYILFLYPKPQPTLFLVMLAVLGISLGSVIYNMWRVHKWWKSAALSAINWVAAQEN